MSDEDTSTQLLKVEDMMETAEAENIQHVLIEIPQLNRTAMLLTIAFQLHEETQS